ncbi:MAG: hydrogenase accessory protein HypB, partial [Gammaproteobacteria bacterium]|nr:hydrogenase accessory protein HypB [Gammaproteobacteria bacterium]
MCTVCGCGEGETRIEGHSDHDHHDHDHHQHGHHHGHDHDHAHDHGHHQHRHDHDHPHDHDHDHAPHVHGDDHDYGQGPARAHAPGLSQSRMVQIEQDILGKNDAYAAANRGRLVQQGILALNLVSSPGSGKTSLLTRTLTDLRDELSLAVIEGDQQTSNDADRIRATGARAIQINTGKGCHLDA